MPERVDKLLVDHGHCESIDRARRLILAGKVRVGPDHVVRKANERWPETTVFALDLGSPFVSRGAGKLRPSLDRWLPRLDRLVGLDIGASTGGFTDLMLQRGAQRVYAVDVGTGQLHDRLRRDERVVVLERTNARYLTRQHIPEPADVLTMDVSFISVRAILPPVAPLLADGAWAFILVKPQFEAKRHEVGRGGVVTDDAVRHRVAEEVCNLVTNDLDWQTCEVTDSPLHGPKGNRELVAVFRVPQQPRSNG